MNLKKKKDLAKAKTAVIPEKDIRALDPEDLEKVSGGSDFENVPVTDEHPYDPNDKDRY